MFEDILQDQGVIAFVIIMALFAKWIATMIFLILGCKAFIKYLATK